VQEAHLKSSLFEGGDKGPCQEQRIKDLAKRDIREILTSRKLESPVEKERERDLK